MAKSLPRPALAALAAALICGAGLAAPAHAESRAHPRTTAPDWAEKPGGDTVARFYPQKAQAAGVPGEARLACKVSLAGRLEGCRVMSESPAGYGFGQAALKIAPSFRMTPGTVDGVPVDGGPIRVPIHFSLSPPIAPTSEGPTPDGSPATSPELSRTSSGQSDGFGWIHGLTLFAHYGWRFLIWGGIAIVAIIGRSRTGLTGALGGLGRFISGLRREQQPDPAAPPPRDPGPAPTAGPAPIVPSSGGIVEVVGRRRTPRSGDIVS